MRARLDMELRLVVQELFHRFARATSKAVGSPYVFALAVFVVAVWAIAGPFFHYSETWQLVINTGTTIVTFLIVFIIQNTQNHDSKAIQLKLDELIRAVTEARDTLIDIEESPEKELARIEAEMRAMSGHLSRRKPHRGSVDDSRDKRR